MIVSNGIIGSLSQEYANSATLDFIEVPWSDAGKRRLRRRTKGGLDFALSLERSQHLFHGAVLFANEDLVIAVSRPKELALVIELGQMSSVSDTVRQATLIGHAFGNQHVPIEVDGSSILVPILSSEDLMVKTVRDLKLGELALRFDHVRLGASHPLSMSGHAHD